MQNPIPLPEPHFLRFVHDFEMLNDWLQAHDESAVAETNANVETLFTTEWQMTSAVEETASV
jgi:hypothetical protein